MPSYENVTNGAPTPPAQPPADDDAFNYVADEQFANVYWQWLQGRWARHTCPQGLVFNSTVNVCDWPRDANNPAPYVLNDPTIG
jgi:hypothetical protein